MIFNDETQIFPGSTVMEQLNFGISKHMDNLSVAQKELYINFQKEIVKTFIAYKGEDETKEVLEMMNQDLNDMFNFEMELVNVSYIFCFVFTLSLYWTNDASRSPRTSLSKMETVHLIAQNCSKVTSVTTDS